MKEINYSNIIPILSKNIKVVPFDNSEFIVEHELLNYQVNVNQSVVNILNLVDGEKTISEITRLFQSKFEEEITEEIVYQILYKKLSKYGIIIQSDFVVKKRAKASYLKLSFELISPRITNAIAKHLTFLFDNTVFLLLITLLPVFIGFLIYLYRVDFVKEFETFISPKLIFYLILFGFWIFIHEFGHAAACKRFGVQTGGIGFGFYLFSPVLYTDVSKAWELKRKERIIVNLAGVYFELIAASLLLLIFLITKVKLLLFIPCYLIINTLYNFNPLIKYDGYWILSDSLGIPHLYKASHQFFFKILKTGKIFLIKNFKDFFLFIYGFISVSFVIIFIFSVLFLDLNSVIYFPQKLYTILTIPHNFKITDLFGLIIPTIFYYLVIKYLLFSGPKFIKNFYRRKKTFGNSRV